MIAPPASGRPELRDYKQLSGDLAARLELSDGSVVEVRAIVQSVMLLGHDPGGGYPLYGLSIGGTLRLVSVGASARASPAAQGAAPPGFA